MAGIPSNPTASVRKLNPHLYPPVEQNLVDVSIGSQAVVRKRIKQSQRKMNKLEAEFFARLQGGWKNVYYEPIRLKLANGCQYIPDFMTITSAGQVYFFEVKGRQMMQDDSVVKIKVAAQQYPLFKFLLVWKEDKEWKEQEVLRW